MQENTVKRISIAVMIVGLTFLFFYAQTIKLPVAEELEGIHSSAIQMRGTVKNLQVTDKAIFFELEGEKIVRTDVILFPDSSIYLHEEDQIELSGQVEEYQGKKELVAEKIVLK